MKALIYLTVFLYIIHHSFSIIPNWDITKIGKNIMTSDKIEYKVCEYENYGHYVKMYRILQKENGSITKTNKVSVDGGKEVDVEFDDIGSFHSLNQQFYICPKGRYHLFDYNNKKYIIPKENFSEGEKFKIKCNYHENSATFLVFYLMNGYNYLYRIYIGTGSSIENIKRAEIVGSQLYDFKLSANLISGQEAAYDMLALNRQGNNIKLSHIDATLRINKDNAYDQSFSQTGGTKDIGNAMDNTQSYFKVSDSDDYMDIYYISYSDINNFYSGYSTKGPSYSDVTSTEISSSKVSFEFYEDVEIEEMNFMPYNRYVYYKMKLKGTSTTKYYGIYDTKLFKVIFNTEEYIKYYIPSSSTEMLAITNTAAYKICAMKNGDKCVDYCSNNYLLDTDINKCSNSATCPDGKIMLVPSGVCNETCDENIYHLKGTECGLCQYFYPNGNKYKLIGTKVCRGSKPNSMKYYNSRFNLLECEEGYKFEGDDCVSDKQCYKNCLDCNEYSEDPLNQKCTECKPGFLLENVNCVTQCSNGYEKKDNRCSSCGGQNCSNFVNNSCDCIECDFHYYLNESKCYQCDYNCGDCSIIPTNCTNCFPPEVKYLYDNICYECVGDDRCEIKREDNCACQTCKEEYYNLNYQCEACVEGCKTCKDSIKCEECKSNFFKNTEETCIPCPENCIKRKPDGCQCETCDENYFMNETTLQCDDCVYGCKLCTNSTKCEECKNDFFKNTEGTCTDCPKHCKTKKQDNCHCQTCEENYYLDETAETCEDCVNGCKLCNNPTKCEECKEGFFKNSEGTCTACPNNCRQRASDNCQCEICEDNYFLNKTQQCEKCDDSCKTCVDNKDKCLSCNTSYFDIGNNKCEKCNIECKMCVGKADNCTGCSDNFFMNDTNECEKCNDSCETCKDNANNCLTCKEGYYLINNNKCEKCDSNCKACSGDKNYCTSCPDGKYLTDGSKCEKCSDICSTCSSGESNGIHNCLSCNNNSEYKYLIYDDYNKTCVKNCTKNGRQINPYKENECLSLNKSDGAKPEENQEKEKNGDDVDYLVWIFIAVVSVLLIIITICICRKCCADKNDDFLEEITTELSDREEIIN